MNKFQKILRKSKKIDKKFERITPKQLKTFRTFFEIPKDHPRFKKIKKYLFSVSRIEKELKKIKTSQNNTILIDTGVTKLNFIKKILEKRKEKIIKITPSENKVKTKNYLDELIKRQKIKQGQKIIIIGGGILINTGSYIAEQTSSDIIIFPTTVLSIADLAGGKVRLNTLKNGKAKNTPTNHFMNQMVFL